MHDQNFKNLILDYPVQALEFFAGEEAGEDLFEARIVPVRQEQLMERLGERFRELDTPLLVEWPDGRKTDVRGLRSEVGSRRSGELRSLGMIWMNGWLEGGFHRSEVGGRILFKTD